MVIPIPGFLFDRATIMLWWDIHKVVPEEHQNAFEAWWGHLAQQYVYLLFESALGPASGTLQRWFKDDQLILSPGVPMSPDAIVMSTVEGKLSLAFIEVKSSRPKYVDLVRGGITDLRNHWKVRLIGEPGTPKAVRQIDRAINEFKAGRLKITGIDERTVETIFPIVLTLDHWPIRDELYSQFTKDVEYLHLLQQKGVAPVEVFSCHDLELLVSRIENGESLLDILVQRRQEATQSTPIRNQGPYNSLPSLLTEVWDKMETDLPHELGLDLG